MIVYIYILLIVKIISAMLSIYIHIYIYIHTSFFVLATGSCDNFSHHHRQHLKLRFSPQMADWPLVFGVPMGTLSSEYVSAMHIYIFIQLFIHLSI